MKQNADETEINLQNTRGEARGRSGMKAKTAQQKEYVDWG